MLKIVFHVRVESVRLGTSIRWLCVELRKDFVAHRWWVVNLLELLVSFLSSFWLGDLFPLCWKRKGNFGVVAAQFDYDNWLNLCSLGKPQNPFEAYRSVKKTSCNGNYLWVLSSLHTKCSITSVLGDASVWVALWISSPYGNWWSFPFQIQVHSAAFRFTSYPDQRSATISSSWVLGEIEHDYRSMLHTCASGRRDLTRKRRHSRWAACVS